MNGLSVVFVNNIPYGSRVYADGRELKVKRDATGVYVANVETEKEYVDISVENPFFGELPFLKWFLLTLFFWAVSLFGLFDTVENKRCVSVRAKIRVKTSDSAFVKLRFGIFRDGAPAVEITETNTEATEVENAYRLDKRAKRRNAAYKAFRIVSIVAAAIITVLIVVKNL